MFVLRSEIEVNMELEAKETRFVILGLKKLIDDIKNQLEQISDEDDDYSYLVNDAVLIDAMIKAYEDEYQDKFGA